MFAIAITLLVLELQVPAGQEAAVVGAFLPVTVVVFYLAVSVLYIVEPLRHIPARIRRPSQPR